MSEITQQLQKEIETLEPKLFYDEGICMRAVSKDLRGELTDAKSEDQQCQRPSCLTRKGRLRLKVRVRPHRPCDSVASHAFDGDIEGELVFAYIDNGYGRGYHVGRIKWSGSASRLLIGQMSGVTNAGTHRSPLDSCEPCDIRGHMEGRLDAVVVEGEHKGCRVLATYAIDFDAASEVQSTDILGTLEGVLICPCEG